MKQKISQPALSLALSAGGKVGGFKDMNIVRDPFFLSEIDIKRRYPLKVLLQNHPNLRMSNRLIQENLPGMEMPVGNALKRKY